MLVLSRYEGETIKIGQDVTIVVGRCSNGRVKLGIEAPRDIEVVRGELTASLTPTEIKELQGGE